MKFAKLFDVGPDHQVVFYVTRDRDDRVCVRSITEIDDIEVAINTAFTDADDDQALARARKMLGMMDQQSADNFFKYATGILGD